MAALIGGVTSPFRRTYLYLQKSAHEQPAIFYSIILGFTGPLAVVFVPPIRKSWGWKPVERPPTTYPLPKRERDKDLKGFEDGWTLSK